MIVSQRMKSGAVLALAKLLRTVPILSKVIYRPFKKYFRRRLHTLAFAKQLADGLRSQKSKSCRLPSNGDEDIFVTNDGKGNGSKKDNTDQNGRFIHDSRLTQPGKIGIVTDPLFCYEAYERACLKYSISYELIDILASNWIELIRNSGCDIFVIWPGECIAEWKKLFDERLWFLTNHLKKKLYPSYESLWLYGSKERQCDWLKLHGFPQPQTEIFFRQEDAMEFVQRARFPLVAKTDIGAAAYGVYILKNRSQASRFIRRVFSRGIVGHCADRSAWQWQHILLQEYLDGELEEWRMVRIGESYFGHLKGRGKDGMHSGSGFCEYCDPGKELLDLTRQVTDTGNFESMALDVFKTAEGRLLINEMQAVFGCAVATTQMKINNVPGRYVNRDGGWHFESGEFCGNNMCDLRVTNGSGISASRF